MVSRSKPSKPTSRDSSGLRKVPKSNAVRPATKFTKQQNKKSPSAPDGPRVVQVPPRRGPKRGG